MKSQCLMLALLVAALFPGSALGHELERTDRGIQWSEDSIGSVSFATSCRAEVQPVFNRGVALLHSFWFTAAIEAFTEVLTMDPNCAIAEWGIAMSHWGNPLGSNRAEERLRLGAEAVARARTLDPANAREQAYIEAIGKRYADFETTTDHSRALAFERAMEDLVVRYPQDTEAAIFLAIALNATADVHDKTYAKQRRAARILELAFEEQPNHPGIAHYIIHSYDVPALARHALPAARQYADIAPAAPHALHMPSHTFTRLGHWQESIDTNLRSADAALDAGSPGEALHALDYMMYAYLQTAQDSAAKSVRERTRAIAKDLDPGDRYVLAGAYAAAAVPARYALELGDWAAAGEMPTVTSPAPFVDAIIYFARGIGAARRGDLQTARAAREDLIKAHAGLGHSEYWAEKVVIQQKAVEAWIALAEGQTDQAVAIMRATADLEDTTEKSPISPGPIAPARELLGEMLLRLQRPQEALQAFQATIEKEPGRFRALYGGGVAADAAGQQDLARGYFARLLEMCASANAIRPELTRAQAYLREGG